VTTLLAVIMNRLADPISTTDRRLSDDEVAAHRYIQARDRNQMDFG
jgi:hypothetical protein